jgi:hypothetical protein
MKNLALSCFTMLLTISIIGCSEGTTPDQTAKKTADAPKTKQVSDSATNCPLCAMKPNSKVATVSFDSKTVGFCSDGCKATFEKKSEAEKKELLAKLDSSLKKDDHDHDHEDGHEHGDEDGHDHKDEKAKEKKKDS